MQLRLMGRFIILSAIALMAFPVGIFAQCPRPGFVHFTFRPDRPLRHVAVDGVSIEGAPDLEASIRTKVDTWLERYPSEKSAETDVTIEVAPDQLEAERARVEEQLRRDAAGGLANWIDALAETVKQVLQDNGYFRAEVSIEKIDSGSDAEQDHASLDIHISEGKQYRLGAIQLNGAQVLVPWQLRNQFPLRDGAIFDLSKLREGIWNLTKMYDSLGYLNFVASPDVRTDDTHQLASVTFDVDEGSLFTVGRVEVLGLPDDSEDELRMPLPTGQPFNPDLVDQFFNDNRSLLPHNATRDNAAEHQNVFTHTFDLVFDFRSCP